MVNQTSGDNKPPPIIKNVETSAGTISLNPGMKPEFKSKKIINIVEKSEKKVSIKVHGSEKELAQIKDHLLNVTGLNEQEFKDKLKSHSGEITSSYIPQIHMQHSVGGKKFMRASAKMLLIYFADLFGVELVQAGQFEELVKYIRDGEDYEDAYLTTNLPNVEGVDFESSICNALILSISESGEAAGCFVFYSTISVVVKFPRQSKIHDKMHIYNVDINNNIINLSTAWKDGAICTQGINPEHMTKNFKKIMAYWYKKAQEVEIEDLIEQTLSELGLKNRESYSEKEYDQFVNMLSFKIANFALRRTTSRTISKEELFSYLKI